MPNNFDALIPEWWAFESLRILSQRLVIANLVNRDYNSMFAVGGEVVNLNRTGTFTALRKRRGEPITIQDATSEADTVKLNQHLHVAYELEDRDRQAAVPDLRERYMVPAATAIAEGIDLLLMGEAYNFLGTTAGVLGTAVVDASMRDLNEAFTRNNVPREGRNLIVGAGTENDLLGMDTFTGDAPRSDSPILNGWIGRARSFNIYVASQASEISAPGIVVDSTTTTVDGDHVVGATTIALTSTLTALDVGSYVTIAGDLRPQLVTARVLGGGGGELTEITIWPGLVNAVADSAVVNLYDTYATGNAETLPVNYDGNIEVSGITGNTALKIGQGVYLTGYTYMITALQETAGDITSITLNRPLDAAVPTSSVLGVAPPGNYNLGLIRDAITLVNRPMQPPEMGTGVRSALAASNNLSLRVSIGYDINEMKYIVAFDVLCGVKTLDVNMGGLLIS